MAPLHTGWFAVAVVAALSVAAAGAALKLTSEQKLVPAMASDGDEVGWGVDIDNGVTVFGAPLDSTIASGSGAVYVYEMQDGAFAETAKLVASDAVAGDELGTSADIDGDVIAAGAYHRWTGTPSPGKAYVFRRVAGNWVEEAILTAPDGLVNDAFGWAVAVDGDFLAVGAPRAWVGSPSGGGGVYIYHYYDGAWNYEGKLSRGSDHAFGWALSMDGDTLVVGSHLLPYERATVYVRDVDENWNIQATLDPPDISDGEFGNSVALDGDTVFVGAWFDESDGNFGSAYVYQRSGVSWTQVQKIGSPGGDLAEGFGEWVAIRGDLAVVTDSGYDRDDEFTDMGAAHLYRRSGSAWAPAGKLTPGDYATYTTYFGTAAAIDGSRVVVGAAYAWDEPSETAPGAVYTYEIASGSKLVIKNASPDNEFKNRIIFRGKGLVADLPLPGSTDDPTCGGGASASIEVTSAVSGSTFGQLLPCANWAQTASGYVYKDPERDDGPCRLVSFTPGGTSKAVCSGSGPSVLNFDLEPSQAQAPIGVTLTLGTSSYCTSFGGNIKSDGTDGKLFKAVGAGAMAPCSAP